MRIVVPLTDYIPASLLTTDGDIVIRGAAIPERLARPLNPSYLSAYNAAGNPDWDTVGAVANRYLKGAGAGFFPAFSDLALRDTGIYIGQSARAVGGDQVIADVGFESSLIIFIACDTTHANKNWSIGFDNGTQAQNMHADHEGGDMLLQATQSIFIDRTGANQLTGNVDVISAVGFTIDWTLVGACGVEYLYICLP